LSNYVSKEIDRSTKIIKKRKSNTPKQNILWWILFATITFAILSFNFIPVADNNDSNISFTLPDAINHLPGMQSVDNFLGANTFGDSQFASYLGLLLFVGIVYLLLGGYLRWYASKKVRKRVNIIILGLLLNVMLLIGKALSVISIPYGWQASALIGLLVPTASYAMLIAALIDQDIAVFSTLILGLLTGLLFHSSLLFPVATMISCLAGISQVANLDQRGKYLTSSIYISGAYMITVLAWGLIWGYHYSLIGVGLVFGFLNGIFSIILTIGCLPFLESAFNVTTAVRLLELSNSNHPLLKRLMTEAPGTYHHSILVGNLAEAAAAEIGANTLLVRVASYFHDVGKLKRPDFFIENIRGQENPHDKLQPSMSVLIITSHPKEGVELAKEYKIPTVIRDIIEQHHGTSLLTAFYQKAQALAERENASERVKEEDYCYLGPKPQTKEAAIVMLADSVQAAVHSNLLKINYLNLI